MKQTETAPRNPYQAPTPEADETTHVPNVYSWPHRLTVAGILAMVATLFCLSEIRESNGNGRILTIEIMTQGVPFLIGSGWLAVSAFVNRRSGVVRVVSSSLVVWNVILLLRVLLFVF